MHLVRVANRTKSALLADRAILADSFIRRGWGLLGHSKLEEGEGMVLTKTSCVHSFFMRFPFDAVYVDSRGSVCQLQACFERFRFGPFVRQARYTIELPVGTIARSGTSIGDLVDLTELTQTPE